MDLDIIIKKIKNIITTQAQIAGRVSKNTHDISDNKKEIEEIDDLAEEAHERIDDLELSDVAKEKDIEHLKQTVDKVEKRFTITKIISIIIAVLTVGFGMISTFLILLKHLGIF